MFGVVLWSNPQQSKAVVWCEDHGELALFDSSRVNSSTLSNGSSFDRAQIVSVKAGDLLCFELIIKGKQRLVCRPKMIVAGQDKDLPRRVLKLAETLQKGRAAGEVLSFPTPNDPEPSGGRPV